MMTHNTLASFLLRAGVATVFLYAAIASFLDPTAWIGFLPTFMKRLVPAETLLSIFSVYELLLAAWILSGKRAFEAGIVAAGTLLGIIVANINALDIVFRDIAILFAAAGFSALHYRKKE